VAELVGIGAPIGADEGDTDSIGLTDAPLFAWNAVGTFGAELAVLG
jgi:hypothetical protein